jgi:succinyl-CoA synthetase alpha subunit
LRLKEVIDMAILVGSETRVIIQGITGYQGRFHSKAMMDYGTKVLGGVTPGKGGTEVNGLPVFDTVREALAETDATASVMFVPARFARDAMMEAIDAGVELLVAITEHIPLHDAMYAIRYARLRGTRIIGPNCPGIVTAGEASLGIMPTRIFREGSIGVVSRSGTLTYEIVNAISEAGLGETTCIGMGGDRVIGTSFVEILQMFEDDPETRAVVLVGEIGGSAEELAAEYIRNMEKPVVAYIAGQSAPPGKRMGHAGAIITRGTGTAESKVRALQSADVRVAAFPDQIPELLKEVL